MAYLLVHHRSDVHDHIGFDETIPVHNCKTSFGRGLAGLVLQSGFSLASPLEVRLFNEVCVRCHGPGVGRNGPLPMTTSGRNLLILDDLRFLLRLWSMKPSGSPTFPGSSADDAGGCFRFLLTDLYSARYQSPPRVRSAMPPCDRPALLQ